MSESPDINIKFKSPQEIQAHASATGKVLVLCDNYVLDVTNFAKHHPGGDGLILNYRSKDITEKMKGHFPLSLTMANTMVIGSFEKEIKRIIDPTKAFMPQIWNMDHESYMKIVDSPHWLFIQTPRMFESNFFEMFTHVKVYQIFIVPTIILSLLACGLEAGDHSLGLFSYLMVFLCGVLLWTLTEYSLHRFIFHSEKHLFNNKLLRYIHFLAHGIHHMLPCDPDRLLYPAPLSILVAIFGYYLVYVPLRFEDDGTNLAFWFGFMIGYLNYDITHYLLHHIKTKKGTYFNRLQRYHNSHHYSGEDAGYGVSSKLWDIILGTQLSRTNSH